MCLAKQFKNFKQLTMQSTYTEYIGGCAFLCVTTLTQTPLLFVLCCPDGSALMSCTCHVLPLHSLYEGDPNVSVVNHHGSLPTLNSNSTSHTLKFIM